MMEIYVFTVMVVTQICVKKLEQNINMQKLVYVKLVKSNNVSVFHPRRLPGCDTVLEYTKCYLWGKLGDWYKESLISHNCM